MAKGWIRGSRRGKRVAQVPKYTYYFNGHYLDAITTTRVQVELLGHMKIVEGAISFLSNNTHLSNLGISLNILMRETTKGSLTVRDPKQSQTSSLTDYLMSMDQKQGRSLPNIWTKKAGSNKTCAERASKPNSLLLQIKFTLLLQMRR